MSALCGKGGFGRGRGSARTPALILISARIFGVPLAGMILLRFRKTQGPQPAKRPLGSTSRTEREGLPRSVVRRGRYILAGVRRAVADAMRVGYERGKGSLQGYDPTDATD